MKTYYIVRVDSIAAFYLAMPMGGGDALGPKLTPCAGNSRVFGTRESAEMYAKVVKGYGFKADICKFGIIGSYGV